MHAPQYHQDFRKPSAQKVSPWWSSVLSSMPSVLSLAALMPSVCVLTHGVDTCIAVLDILKGNADQLFQLKQEVVADKQVGGMPTVWGQAQAEGCWPYNADRKQPTLR